MYQEGFEMVNRDTAANRAWLAFFVGLFMGALGIIIPQYANGYRVHPRSEQPITRMYATTPRK